ncbi:hypothetical protein Hanom_Chr03g00183451 [Helianthus anomalus]
MGVKALSTSEHHPVGWRGGLVVGDVVPFHLVLFLNALLTWLPCDALCPLFRPFQPSSHINLTTYQSSLPMFTYIKIRGKITSFVIYLYITFQVVSFLTNVDRRCPLLGILLQV